MSDNRILVAMSGGVDSAVCALLLCRAGAAAAGVTMKLHPDGEAAACCTEEDVAEARAVCGRLGIPHDVSDFSGRFREQVILPFVEAYENGRTPNPCIECNRNLKFAALFDYADARGYARVATGHYARTAQAPGGRTLLLRARDGEKDQSYVLYTLTQAQLSRVSFPLGELTKSEVRAMAAEAGFSSATRPESQDICFVKGENYAEFIERFRGKTYPEGDFLSPAGELLGRHRGIIRYTVGQRKGLGIALGAPAYVCAVNPAENTVILGAERDLYQKSLVAHKINLIATDRLDAPLRVSARVRYRQAAQPATVWQTDTDELRVEFDAPQRAITRGQAVVLYDGDVVVGGGVIS